MTWIATPESSQISGFDYDKSTRGLTIEFTHGGFRYTYENVPESVVEGLKAAPSKGNFFRQNIKNAFRFQKV